MSERHGATIVLQVTRAAPAPAGELSGLDGVPEQFDGWLQLLSALERRLELLADSAEVKTGE